MDKSIFTADYLRAQTPMLFHVAREARGLDSMRERIAGFAHQIYFDTFYEPARKGGTALIRKRDCTQALQTILAKRSDKLAGFSVARALRDISRGRSRPDLQPGFYADLLYLLLGIHGRGPGKSPADEILAPSSLTGRAAAVQRSRQLDSLSKRVERAVRRFPTGLDPKVVARRAKRRARILDVLGGSETDWVDWRWQARHVLRDPDILGKITELSAEEREGIHEAKRNHVPFGVTPYYASLMDDRPSDRDRSVRFQVLPPRDYVASVCHLRESDPATLDFMREKDTSPIDLITRRYPSICILKPVNTCPQICVYCQRNWEIEEPMDKGGIPTRKKLDAAIDWIAEHPAIREVLTTGGDPFILSDARLKYMLDRLAAIPSIERIRIGSRTPVTMPMRITEEGADLLASYHEPGRREIALATHFQHAYEVSPDVLQAISRLRARHIPVYNQQVYTFFVSRRFETYALRRAMRLVGIDPYYTFNMKGKDEMRDYRVPIARLLQEQKEEARLLPGLSRTDEAVFNVPGLGKNYLRARQSRNLLSLLPDGSRVYEFHPWEKNITRAIETYVGTDVSILEYLERLEAIGEDVKRYQTIWYYY